MRGFRLKGFRDMGSYRLVSCCFAVFFFSFFFFWGSVWGYMYIHVYLYRYVSYIYMYIHIYTYTCAHVLTTCMYVQNLIRFVGAWSLKHISRNLDGSIVCLIVEFLGLEDEFL